MGGVHRGDSDCNRDHAFEEPPSREPSLGADVAELGRCMAIPEAECYGFLILGSPWQQEHHRGPATVPFQALFQPGRKEGTQLGWGHWQGALRWVSQAWMLPPGSV